MSDRSGWTHVYHYAPDGKLIAQVTKGDWDVRGMDGIDEGKGTLYFSSTEHSYIASHEYAIKFDGSGMTRVTSTEGSASRLIQFGRDALYRFVERRKYSDAGSALRRGRQACACHRRK
jgi:dipeptidyl-peptidase-4